MGFVHNIIITFLREYAMGPITLEDIDEAEFIDCTQALAVWTTEASGATGYRQDLRRI